MTYCKWFAIIIAVKTIAVIKQRGNRLTKPRKAISTILLQTKFPLTIKEIMNQLKKNDVYTDTVSIYRTVKLLLNLRCIQQIEFGDGKKRFEAVKENNHHHHIICDKCGKVEEIFFKDENYFALQLKKKTQYKIHRHSLEFFGLCQNCY